MTLKQKIDGIGFTLSLNETDSFNKETSQKDQFD
tara:strand:+ start:314 stop:415 length:102 start_codon:yes stop_codon:yes gene_type:complete